MLQQYVNQEFPDIQAGFRKGRGTRDQIANIHWIIKRASEFQKKTSTSALLTTPKPLTVWITTNWKILQEMGIPDHFTCLLRNLYAGQGATIRLGHGKTDWFQISKSVRQGCILSPCLFNLSSPGGSDGKSIYLQCKRPRSNPWVGKIPWRRK